jgi:hypothetical protein
MLLDTSGLLLFLQKHSSRTQTVNFFNEYGGKPNIEVVKFCWAPNRFRMLSK